MDNKHIYRPTDTSAPSRSERENCNRRRGPPHPLACQYRPKKHHDFTAEAPRTQRRKTSAPSASLRCSPPLPRCGRGPHPLSRPAGEGEGADGLDGRGRPAGRGHRWESGGPRIRTDADGGRPRYGDTLPPDVGAQASCAPTSGGPEGMQCPPAGVQGASAPDLPGRPVLCYHEAVGT